MSCEIINESTKSGGRGLRQDAEMNEVVSWP